MVSELRTRFDPVTLEILWSRLVAIVDESAAALLRTSFSTNVRESNDFACSLLDAGGNSLADSSASCPAFLGTMPRTVRHILHRFPAGALQPGDVIVTNDPWFATGHLNDFTVVAPIFHRGRLVAFTGNIAHSADIGGPMWTADAQEVFEEGLRVPPTRLRKAGRLNEELVELICGNVRVPEQVIGDLHAQVAATAVCARRLIDILEEQGMEDLSSLGETIQSRAEASMRQAIEAVPDGEYSHAVQADGYDHPLTIRIKITVRGGDLRVDFAGSSPQIGRGVNSVYNYTYAYTTYPLKCILDPLTPKNEGSFRPITIEAPEGTIVNPRFPAPVSARHLTGLYLAAAVFGAMASAVPDQVIGDPSAPHVRVVFAGVDSGGQRFSQALFPQGGMGARPTQDGLSCTAYPNNTSFGSFEVIESVSPLLCWQRQMIADSGGPGKFRGGLGQEIAVQLASEEPARLSVISERLKFPPLGLLGGHPGAPAGIQLNEGDPVPAKGRTSLKPGDLLRVRYAGAGGYGPPRERERARVLADLKNELITPAAAREIYGLDL